jgi:hypothetical protein
VLQGFAQLILIQKTTGAVKPTASQICELALATLNRDVEHFAKDHNFQLNPNKLFLDYQKATKDANPTWILGSTILKPG